MCLAVVILFLVSASIANAQSQFSFTYIGADSSYIIPIIGGGYFHRSSTLDSGFLSLSIAVYSEEEESAFLNYLSTLQTIHAMFGPFGTNRIRILLNVGESLQQYLAGIPNIKRYTPYLGTPGTHFKEPDVPGPEVDFGAFSMPSRKLYPITGSYPGLAVIQQALTLRDTVDGQHNGTLLSAHFNKQPHCAGEQRFTRLFLSNNGHVPLTSAKIGVAFNGIEQQVIEWSGGPLATYRYAVIDSVPFTTDGMTADVTFYIKEVNGQPDFEKSNDTLRYNLKGSVPVSAKEATLLWKTANYTYTTYIDIVDEATGDVLFSVGDPIIAEGGFTTITEDTFANGTVYSFPVDLNLYGSSCLRLRAYNQYHAYFATWLNLVVEGDTVISLSGWPAPLLGKEATFHTTFVPSDEVNERFAVLVYPNPLAAGLLSVDLPERPGSYGFELYDMLARRVFDGPVQQGHNMLSLPTLPPGLYSYAVRSSATGAVASSGQLLKNL
jgi:hypothetical protein